MLIKRFPLIFGYSTSQVRLVHPRVFLLLAGMSFTSFLALVVDGVIIRYFCWVAYGTYLFFSSPSLQEDFNFRFSTRTVPDAGTCRRFKLPCLARPHLSFLSVCLHVALYVRCVPLLTVCCLTSPPHITLSYPTLPYPAYPTLALSHPTVPCHTLPYLTLHHLTPPRPALPRPTLPCPTLSSAYITLPGTLPYRAAFYNTLRDVTPP